MLHEWLKYIASARRDNASLLFYLHSLNNDVATEPILDIDIDDDLKPKEKKRFGPYLILFACGMGVGVLFTIQHWPYGHETMYVSSALLGATYALRFLFKTTKHWLDLVKLILVLSWVVRVPFVFEHWPYRAVLDIIVSLSLVVWIFAEGPSYFMGKAGSAANKISTIIFRVAAIGVLYGILGQIMSWPYSSEILLGGLAICLIWAAHDFFTGRGIEE
ncbi:hypothetical protein OAA53_01145 [Salibacteraceae bacterium]|nr:hypothetical protein [Salibacteraceae bacterium]